MSEYKLYPVGDQALKVVFENKIDQVIHEKVKALDESLLLKKVAGIQETIPAFRTLTVLYDATKTDYSALSNALHSLLSESEPLSVKPKRIIEIPVCYDAHFGIDLKDVAEHSGLSVEEVVKLHSERDYLIYMLGFLPGFAYLGGMNSLLNISRLDNPRLEIKEGAVGIAGNQTGIYPMNSPGGWRIIGSTPVSLFDPKRNNPFLYESGDYIRFKPVSLKEYDEIAEKCVRDTYQCTVWIEEDH